MVVECHVKRCPCVRWVVRVLALTVVLVTLWVALCLLLLLLLLLRCGGAFATSGLGGGRRYRMRGSRTYFAHIKDTCESNSLP